MNRYKLLSVVLALFLVLPLIGQDSDRDHVKEIVQKMDDLYRGKSSFVAMEMEIVTPHWQRKLKMNAWSLGMEKFFVRILEPKKERGMATLKLGNEMWNFLPKTNKVMKIPPSMMMGSWMGSDFTNDDLVKEYTFFDDYSFELIRPQDAKDDELYVKCIPRENLPIVWGSIVIAVKKDTYIPVYQRYFDEKGTLMREMLFKEVTKFGKKTIPAVMELHSVNKKGNKTIIRYLKAEFDIKVDKSIFSLRNLRSRI